MGELTVSRRLLSMSITTVLLASVPALALAAPLGADSRKAVAAKPAKKKISTEAGSPELLKAGGLGAFTPSIIDPTRSPALSRGVATAERTFRFTPSGKSGDRKSLTLGLTTRVVAKPERDRTAATAATPVTPATAAPTGYNVGLTLGFDGFALTGGYSRLETIFGPRREGIDLGLSYRSSRWKASLQASGEQPLRGPLALDPLSLDKRYGVELGGAYALTPRLSVTGGMRYQLVTPLDPALRDAEERGDPAVFVGTAFSF